MPKPWYQRPTTLSVEEATEVLNDPRNQKAFPKQYKQVIQHMQQYVENLKQEHKAKNPLAFFIPSYEQALFLNAWFWGITFPIIFAANRFGKTTSSIINSLLWILPNDPSWLMFQEYTDHLGRKVKVLRRPALRPRFPVCNAANPLISLYEQQDVADRHQRDHPFLLAGTPDSPIKDLPSPIQIWHGAPTGKFHDEVVIPEWEKWVPKSILSGVVHHKYLIKLETDTHKIEIHCKSYDSDDTVWAGAAVTCINLTEGITPKIMSEVKQRFKYPAWAFWDYTPVEARNSGSKSLLAHKVFKGEEKLPLQTGIFSGISLRTAPEHIISKEKMDDILTSVEGKPEAAARIDGNFFTSSPVLLSKYNPKLHCIPWTIEEFKKRYPLHTILRGVDHGWAHPTTCAWQFIVPDGTRFIYRFYSQSQRIVDERCDDIITLSGNKRVKHPTQPTMFVEQQTGEKVEATYLDYHVFKADETTGQPYSTNYIKAGLIVRRSITIGPKERALQFDNLLRPIQTRPHPNSTSLPGGMLYFLTPNNPDGYSVKQALAKMENLMWKTYEGGARRGEMQDTPQDFNDDELDGACYVALQPFTPPKVPVKQHRELYSAVNFV